MKIALLVKRFTLSGGKERYVVELARSLRDLGHSVDVFACKADHHLLEGMGFYQVPIHLKFSSVLNTFSFVRETEKMLQKYSYDIVHSHERNYTQKILTLHSFSYLDGMEKYSFLSRIDQKYLSLRSGLYLWLERRQMNTPWLVSVSEEVSKDVKKHYNRSGNIVTIPPGVDLTLFNPEIIGRLRDQVRSEKKLAEDELVVLFVGSAFQRKGLDRLIPAIDKGMSLFVVGKGDRLAKYKRLIKRYGLERKVSFEGIINDVRKYYALADVVVLPSRSEAFGMSILEGMACGLPVIVSSNSGIADLINHNENGFVMYEDSDISVLLNLLRSQKERLRIGKCARKSAEAYSWTRVGIAHEKFYRQVLSQESLI